MKQVVIIEPWEAKFYKKIEEGLRLSVVGYDFNPKTGKHTVKISKYRIEQLIKDCGAFADLEEDEIEIVWF